MAERVSSRLVKKETHKLMRRTVILSVVAIVTVLAFLFLVLPNFIRLVVWFSRDKEAGATSQGLQFIQPPILQPPQSASSQPKIDITGYGRGGNEIILIVNGSEITRQAINEDGTFSISLDLVDGENAISAYQVAEDDSESEVSEVYTVKFDNQAPTLEIESPTENQEVSGKDSQFFEVKGKVNEDAQIHVNERVTFINDDLTFSYKIQLQEGDNTITIKAIDDAGNTGEVVRIVKYKK